jgi:hypothetical protein
MNKPWKTWYRNQSPAVQLEISEAAIERLIEIEEVSFVSEKTEDEPVEEYLFWTACGEPLH